MSDTQLIHDTNIQNLNVKAADIIADSINQFLQVKEQVIIALCGGRNVQEIYKLFRENNRIPWQDVHIFLLDERLVKIDSEESNFKLIYESFVRFLEVNQVLDIKNVHPFNYTGNIEKDLENYKNELLSLSDRFDIILASMGEDGHIGALAANHHSIRDQREFFISMDDSPKPPLERMSASRKLVSKAGVGILLAIGEAKRNGFENLKNPTVSIEACPAKLILELPTNYVLTDLA